MIEDFLNAFREYEAARADYAKKEADTYEDAGCFLRDEAERVEQAKQRVEVSLHVLIDERIEARRLSAARSE